jgi:6-phosphogluconolactonase
MARNDNRQVIPVADAKALAKTAADRIMARIAANGDRVAICLTGGSSPKQLYQLLATEAYRSQIPWQRVHWFIGDERFVPADDPLNNMAMARRTFLDLCAPAANVHPIPTDTADPEQAARRYQSELQSFYGAKQLDSARPLFDVVLMGVGPDGHTASLFPGYPAIDETVRWVVGVPKAHVEPFVPRVTLTLPALNSCREMLFEVSGADKRAILTRVLAGENLPANRAHSIGETIWLADKAALPENFRGQ